MTIRDIREALEQTHTLGDGDVQVTVKAGRAHVIITASKNTITVKTDKSLETEKVRLQGADHVLHMEEEKLGSAVTVLSQINEA
jgi:hypothetical protein